MCWAQADTGECSAHTRPSFSLWEYAPFNLNFPDIKLFVGYRNLGVGAGRVALMVCLEGENLVADPRIRRICPFKTHLTMG